MVNLTQADRDDIMSTAHALADAASDAILPYFRTPSLEIENKEQDGFDPVTIADRAAEKAMRDVLARQRPQDAILGEEYGAQAGTSGLTWVLDPIDGTRGFMSGTPTWGVLIAVSDATGPILGIIAQPYIRERFVGGFGEAYVDGPSGRFDLQTRQTTHFSDAVIFTTFPEVGSPRAEAGFRNATNGVKLVRYGMDCYAYALVAAGQVDAVIESGLNSYDIQAPIAVIEAAGGIVTNWTGGPVHEGGQALAVGNKELHAKLLEKLRPYAEV